MEDNIFTNVSSPEEGGTLFDGIPAANEAAPAVALPTSTLLTTMAQVDTSKSPTLQMTEQNIELARNLIETGGEATLRSKLAANDTLRQMTNLNTLGQSINPLENPKAHAAISSAYQEVTNYNIDQRAKTALEDAAIKNIQDVAARDSVQGKLLLNNLEHGDASQVMHDNLVTMSILSQRAEELDSEYGQQGWGKTIFNLLGSLVPTNFNFARSGIVEGSGAGMFDWVFSGEGLRKQGETLWGKLEGMTPTERADYLSKDGELMTAIRKNATTPFGLTFDPQLGSEITKSLTSQSDSDRKWADAWGTGDIAMGAEMLGAGKILGASKTLLRAGARKESLDLLQAASEKLATSGPEAMTKATGITEEELRANQSISMVDPDTSAYSVPQAMDIATREEAARAAIADLPGIVQSQRLTSQEEIMAAYEGRLKEFSESIGRPIKDVAYKTETVADGREVRYAEVVIGKTDGGGFAKEATTKTAAKSMGLEGEAFRDESGQWFVRARVNVPESGFRTNELHPPTQGFLSRMTGRFIRDSAKITDKDLHGRAVAAGSTINRQERILHESMKNIFSSVNARSKEMIEQIALIGANNKRWYTDGEFTELMQRGFNREATEHEIGAYRQLQLHNDMDWVLRNDQAYVDKIARGYESAKFGPYDLDGHINYNPKVKPLERVFNYSDNIHYTSQNPLTTEELERLSEQGYVLFTPEKSIKVGGEIKVNKVLIKKGDLEISPLRRNQLAYSEGGHRLYTDKVFVKQAQVGKQGDTGKEYLDNPNTFVTAKNIAEGKKWVEVMERARLYAKDGGLDAQHLDDEIFKGDRAFPSGSEFLDKVSSGFISKDHPFEVLYDRQLPSVYNEKGPDVSRFIDEDEAGYNGYYRTTGKMYTSSKGEILKDTSGEIAATVDPYEALSTSLRQITRQTGLYAYKEDALERFKNTYGQYLTVPENASPYQLIQEGIVRPTVSRELRNQIEAQRASIQHVLGFETPWERGMRETYRASAEAILGTGDNAARKFAHDAVYWWKEKNPVSFLRGLASDAKLGVWNVGQFFIQSSTMFSALALSPEFGVKGMGSLPLHGYLLSGGSEAVLDTLAKRGVAKMSGFASEKEFKDYARFIKDSGFMDMNGSHLSVGQNGPVAHFGSFNEKFNSVREHGKVFFYAAETWNRLVASRIAYGRLAEQGIHLGNPEFTAKFFSIADDYSLNMTNQSAAYWQKGVLSIPTQFWGYSVRMMDAMMGKTFTPMQRTRLALMNLGMAGSAGIPLVSAVSDYLQNQTGEAPKIDSLLGTLDRGLIDRLAYEYNGADVRIGDKVGTGSWVSDTAQTLFGASQYGEKSFAELVGGATYSIFKSLGGSLWDAQRYAFAESGGDMGKDAIRDEGILRMFQEISTVSNVTKAMMVNNYGIYKSKGGTIQADGLPAENAIYIALGYQPQTVDSTGHMMTYLKNKEDATKELSKTLRNWRQEAFTNPDKFIENYKKANFLIKMTPVDIRRDVIRQSTVDSTSLGNHIEKKYYMEQAKAGNE